MELDSFPRKALHEQHTPPELVGENYQLHDDTWDHLLSRTTLVEAATDVTPYEAMREKFVSLIKNEKRLENVHDDITKLLLPESFEERFRDMLEEFAARLSVEASCPEERDVARAASTNRPYIAKCVSEEIFKMAEFKHTTEMPLNMSYFQDELLNYPMNSDELVAGSVAGSPPTENWLKVRSLHSRDNGWSTIDFQQPSRQSFDSYTTESHKGTVFNPIQTLNIRTHSDSSRPNVPQSTYSYGTPRGRDLPEPRLLRYGPEVPPAAAESFTDTIRPTNNPTQQVQADSSIQQHTILRPFQCNYPGCNSKGFGRKYEFRRHMKKHSRDQLLFPCPVVGCHFHQLSNAFYRHDKLGSHMQTHHPGIKIPDIRDFERVKDDGLDSKRKGPIKLLNVEAFIESSKAWSDLLDDLEGWVRDTKRAQKLEKMAQRPDTFNKALVENPGNGSGDTSPLASSWDRKKPSKGSSLNFIANASAETRRSTQVNSNVSALQVALLSAWTIKTFVKLYGQSSDLMQIAIGYIAIILPMYATILLPREQVLKSYILCLFIPKAYMVYASALGFAILASRTYLPTPSVAKSEKFHRFLGGSPKTEKGTLHARVKWHCTCGDEFHEDFAEAQERDAIALFKRFCRTGNRAQLEISSRDAMSTTEVFGEGLPGFAAATISHANNQQPSVTGASDFVTRLYGEPPVDSSTHNYSPQNSTSEQPGKATGVAQSSSTADSGESRDEWLLLCHDYYENAGKAMNVKVPDVLDDLSLTRHLRCQYILSRGGLARHFKWSRIKNFNFVRFQAQLDLLAQEELVFKEKEWGVPVDFSDFNWSPWPLEERPPIVVERMLRHYWHYPHDSMSFRFANACKHLSQKIWQNCQSGSTDLLGFISHRPAPSSIWTTMRKVSSQFYTSARSMFKKTWSSYKLNKTSTLPQSNHDINLRSQAPQGNDQQQHSGTSPATPHTCSRQGTNPSAVTQSILQPRLPHTISSVYPRRLHTELHPNPTCYGWGLYLDEGFAVPAPLIALLLILLFAVLISTLTVALVDFHRGDRYDAFSLPSWAVSVASLVGFILFWCCDRWR